MEGARDGGKREGWREGRRDGGGVLLLLSLPTQSTAMPTSCLMLHHATLSDSVSL